MLNDQKVARAVAAAYVNDRSKVINLLNEYGASIKPNATNEKVLNVLKSFMTSNRKFASKFMAMLFKKGYLKQSDIKLDSSNLSTSNQGFLNTTGEENSDKDASSVAVTDSIWGGVIDTVGGLFKRPEANQETLTAIINLEAQKQKRQAGTGKYLIAAAAILGVMAIGGIFIYKSKK